MSMQTDVKAAHLEATGTVISGRNRLKAYHCISGGTAGDVIYRDGGASGAVRLQFNIGTGTQPVSLLVPGEGILFETSIHVTLPATAKITTFYG
jgi:hypothetical protein